MAEKRVAIAFQSGEKFAVVYPKVAPNFEIRYRGMQGIPGADNTVKVRAATTANITLTGLQTIDGVMLVAGDRVLVRAQTNATQNGIYTVASGAWTRAQDEDTSPELAASIATVSEGTSFGGTMWRTDFRSTETIGTDTIDWFLVPSAVGTGTAGQVLASGGGAVQTWTTLTLDYLPDAWTKRSVKAATTANITLSGTQTIDGVALVAGDRVLVKNQTSTQQNGIYVVASGAWTRSSDANTAAKISGAIVAVDLGTINVGQKFTTSFSATATLDTTGMFWGWVTNLVNTSMSAGGVVWAAGTFEQRSTAAGLDGQILESGATATPRWITPWNKKAVKAATTANITLSAPQTIDGISIVAGDRVLVKDQTTASQNGIYLCAADAWTRALDADTSAEISSACVAVDQGTANGGTEWTNYFKSTDTLGTTNMNWFRILDSSRMGVAGGLATLDGAGKLTVAQLQPTTLDVILPDAWVKRSVKAATTANITLSGTQTLDGIAVIAGDRVLVKNQTASQDNGIYIVAAGAWTRSTDADSAAEVASMAVAIDSGTQAGTIWQTAFKSTDTLGTTAMVWGRIFTTMAIVGVGNGGTGLTTLTQGGLLYASSASAMAVTPAGSAAQTLWSNASSAPLWFTPAAKIAVLLATNADHSLTGLAAIDGVTPVAGNLILVRSQTNPAQNGIYNAASGAWTRNGFFATAAQLAAAIVTVTRGTALGGKTYTTSFKDTDTVGTTAMPWYEVIDFSKVGSASGVAGLSGAGYVPVSQLGSGAPGANTFLAGDGVWKILPPAAGAGDVFGPGSAGDSNIVLFDTTTGKAIKDSGITIAMLTADNGPIKPDVKGATTANITLSGTQTIDGSAFVVGDRILVKNQTTPSENGIYVVQSGAWTRAADADTALELSGAVVKVAWGGTQNTTWWRTNFPPNGVIGTTGVNWYQILDANSSLDATKLTNTIADARLPARLGTDATGRVVTDANSATDTGSWRSAAGATNNPNGTAAFVGWSTQYSSSGPYVLQIAAEVNGSQRVYKRICSNGSWSAWKEITTVEDADARYVRPGLVTLSALVPDAWLKQSVKVATTANITLSGTQTIDGIAVVAGDRVLVKNQTTTSQNGIYDVAAGAWARSADADSADDLNGATINIEQGTQGGLLYTNNFKITDTVGTTAMPWYRVYDSSQTIPLTNGGTGSPLGPVAGAVVYSSAGSMQMSAAGSAAQLLMSNGTAAPSWISLPVKQNAVVATTANITLSGAQTIDGFAVTAGMRVLVKDQSTPSQNGLYDVSAGAWTRTVGTDTAAELASSIVAVERGTAHAGKIFHTDFSPGGTVGSTNVSWYEVYDSRVRGAANGIASLDASTLVPTGLMGTGTATASAFLRGDRTWSALPVASDTVQGIVELATPTEAQAGTDTVRAVTPAGVKAYVDNNAVGYDPLAYKGNYNPATAYLKGDTIMDPFTRTVYRAKQDVSAGIGATLNSLTFVGVYSNSANTSSTATTNVTVPAGVVQQGDVMLYIAGSNGTTPPTGWLTVTGAASTSTAAQQLFYRIATAADAAGFTISWPGSAWADATAYVRIYRNATYNPAEFRADNGSGGSNTSQSTSSAANALGSTANRLEITMWTDWYNSASTPTIDTSDGAAINKHTASQTSWVAQLSYEKLITDGSQNWSVTTMTSSVATWKSVIQVNLRSNGSYSFNSTYWEALPFFDLFMTDYAGGMEAVAVPSTTTGTVNIDLSLASIFTIDPTGNITLAFQNVPSTSAGTASIRVIVNQNATVRTVSVPSNVKWIGSAPTQVASKVCVLEFHTYDGGMTWLASGGIEG